jgi:hypothetical protein
MYCLVAGPPNGRLYDPKWVQDLLEHLGSAKARPLLADRLFSHSIDPVYRNFDHGSSATTVVCITDGAPCCMCPFLPFLPRAGLP